MAKPSTGRGRSSDRAGSRAVWTAAAALLLALIAPTAPAQSEPTAPAADRDCFAEIASGAGQEIACRYHARLTEEERADLKSLTREVLQDARCSVDIRIARQKVELALAAFDHVFEAPPQPVTCDLTTQDGSFPIGGTFAPRVVFKSGKATDGSPRLANVTGVNGYLAWPVIQYVNRSARIRDGMLTAINAYLAHGRRR